MRELTFGIWNDEAILELRRRCVPFLRAASPVCFLNLPLLPRNAERFILLVGEVGESGTKRGKQQQTAMQQANSANASASTSWRRSDGKCDK